MIGHESIVTTDAVRCRCGHVLASDPPETITWTSEPDPYSFQAVVDRAHDAHIAELANRRLYGIRHDEYLQRSPEAVYERWLDDTGLEWLEDHDGTPLEIIEWSVVDLDNQIPRTDWLLETIAEHISDECGYTEAFEAADRACKHPDVVEACEAMRSEIAAKFTGWLTADRELRTLVVTWNEAGEPLLDGEPMYVKAPK